MYLYAVMHYLYEIYVWQIIHKNKQTHAYSILKNVHKSSRRQGGKRGVVYASVTSNMFIQTRIYERRYVCVHNIETNTRI